MGKIFIWKSFTSNTSKNSRNREKTTVAKFIVPDWGIQWTMAYRPAGLCSPGGLYDKYRQPYDKVDFIFPVRDYEFAF